MAMVEFLSYHYGVKFNIWHSATANNNNTIIIMTDQHQNRIYRKIDMIYTTSIIHCDY